MTTSNFLSRPDVGDWPAEMVVLRDRSVVLIRQVQAADAPLLADGFARLSAESRWTRCLGAKKELSPAELRYLTDVDHHDHEALGALEYPGGQGVGIVRYIRPPGDPQTAEIAVTVVDSWQGRGLGTELIRQLSRRAWHEGIRRFTAMATADNVAAVRLLRTMGAQPVRCGSGAVEYEIILPNPVRVDGAVGLLVLVRLPRPDTSLEVVTVARARRARIHPHRPLRAMTSRAWPSYPVAQGARHPR